MNRIHGLFASAAFCVVVGMLGFFAPSPLFAAPHAQAGDQVIIAAGDIANCSNIEAYLTASLIEGIEGTVLPLGDLAYEVGSLVEFNNCYGPTWGRFNDRVRPTPGNHEYGVDAATGYFTYFGDIATPLEPGCKTNCKGYYSFNLGAWHLIALNSEIPHDAGSEQEQWLRADLAANSTLCTLAYWHRPRFASGNPDRVAAHDLFQALYDYGVDVLLVAHEHNYERFGPQDPSGQAAPGRGVRQIIVGTGGAPLRDFRFIQPNSEVRNSETWGVLKMTLRPTGYDWEFIPISGQSFTDAGSDTCITAGELPAPPAGATANPPAAATTTGAPTANSAAAATATTATSAALPAGGLEYVVQAGDTLSLIAGRYGLDWRQLAAANQLSNPNIIEVGQVLRLPGAQNTAASPAATVVVTPTSSAAVTTSVTTAVTSTVASAPTAAVVTAPATTGGGRVHTVAAGDTIIVIAARYGLNWRQLLQLNGLQEDSIIQVGQQIRLE